MQNMWNTFNNNLLLMGHKQFFGPNTNQKRHFGYDFPSVGNIAGGKSFNNPNFVNKDYPRVHNYQRTDSSVTPSHFQTDSNNSKPPFSNVPYINSCQSIIENIKEKKLDIVQPIHSLNIEAERSSEISCDEKPIMCNKRTRKTRMRSKKSQSYKKPEKSMKSMRQEINDMMEVDMEPQYSSNLSDTSLSPRDHNSLTLSDFIHNNSFEKENVGINFDTDEINDSQDYSTIISQSPSDIACSFKRERTTSVADSEDSFIVFESGTDDELEFSDNSQEDDESDEENTDDDDLDSSPSVVPRKKVRFADDNELCQVHPMIMWSYAYQKARIGPWQKYAVDRVRFKDHIKNLEEKIKPVLDVNHRERIFHERFQCQEVSQG